MSAEENKALARRYIEDVWNKGDFAAEQEVLAPDFVDHNPTPGFPATREGHHQVLSMFRTAFPDMRLNLECLVAEGDKVVDHWTATGTHRGDMMGIPPSDKRFTITGSDIAHIENGKITELWHQEDTLGLLSQIGVIPSLG
jgi:steroid delta-isomerase-like uncharacterized protein